MHRKQYINAVDVFEPSSLVHDVFYRHTRVSQYPAQFRYSARSIADGDAEPEQPPLGSQSALQAATESGRVNISTAEQQHNSGDGAK